MTTTQATREAGSRCGRRTARATNPRWTRKTSPDQSTPSSWSSIMGSPWSCVGSSRRSGPREESSVFPFTPTMASDSEVERPAGRPNRLPATGPIPGDRPALDDVHDGQPAPPAHSPSFHWYPLRRRRTL